VALPSLAAFGCRLEACATKRDRSFITDSVGLLTRFAIDRGMRPAKNGPPGAPECLR
jgi:hypothetical protein